MNNVTEFFARVWQSDFVSMIVTALIVVAATAIVSHVVTKFVHRVSDIDGVSVPSGSIIINIARVLVWGLGLCLALSILGFDVTALIAALGIGGIALSLGLQDTIANVLGGLQATLLKIVQPGDYITVGGISGIVQDVNWRQTEVKDIDNNIHIIPNSIINSSTVSKGRPSGMVVVPFSTMGACGDLEALAQSMERSAKAAVERVAPLAKDPWVLFYETGDYGIHGNMRFVLQDAENLRDARDAAVRAIAPFLTTE